MKPSVAESAEDELDKESFSGENMDVDFFDAKDSRKSHICSFSRMTLYVIY